MITVRLRFEKKDYAIFYSNLDLQRVFQRAMKKSGLPVWYSKGFNPRIYLTFTFPLSLGHASLCESCDFKLNEFVEENTIIERLQPCLPEGIILKSAKEPTFAATEICYAKYKITLFDDTGHCKRIFEDYFKKDRISVVKKSKKGDAEIDIKPLITDIDILEASDDFVVFTAVFPAGGTYNINPNLLLEYFEKEYGTDRHEAFVTRLEILDKNKEILE